MCGRYVSPDQAAIERAWSLIRGGGNIFNVRYNVTPQQGNPRAYIPAIRSDSHGEPELAMLQWWLVPHWSKEPRISYSTFNARAETVATAASFRVPFKKRRCLIPAVGWYEWQQTPQGKVKWWLHRPHGELVHFAGLWDRWHREDQVIESCTIIVGASNKTLRPIHDRMPVIIDPKEYDFWLDPAIDAVPALQELLTAASEEAITAQMVRNDKHPRDDDATLIEAIG